MGLKKLRQAAPDATNKEGCGDLQRSRRSKWRALALLLVHLIIVAHIIQWKITGVTTTPVEPSEAMQTLELGYVNAGFVLFVVLILSTLVLGRWFCGWACHVVAYQDLCGWLLRKVGVKPKPFRSRLLVWVPLGAALYMFVWPQVVRIWEGREFPPLVYHFTTEDFWAPFPSFWISVLTLGVCGFLIVYLLGNKGFCTYGCPYGGIFYNADRVAPGKIRVTDACDGCGHCTSTCTSNVRVHEEVKLYGMVVDPGCMKCFDCVSVCPKKALYYGFGKPSLAKGRPKAERRVRKYDFTWSEELAMAGFFFLALYAFRGLYDAIPFLLSLGMASISAFLLLQGVRLAFRDQVRLQRWQLRSHGRIYGLGWAYGGFVVLLFAYIVHSAVLQWHVYEGNRHLVAADRIYGDPSVDQARAVPYAEAALTHFRWARANSPFQVADWEAKTGSLELFLGNLTEAERRLRLAVALNPDMGGALYTLGKALRAQGKWHEAATVFGRAAEEMSQAVHVRMDQAEALVMSGRNSEAVAIYEALAENDPSDPKYGSLMAKAGDLRRAETALRRAVGLNPSSPVALRELALVLLRQNQFEAALTEAEKAVRLDGGSVESWAVVARIFISGGKPDRAREVVEDLRASQPYNPAVLALWAEVLDTTGAAKERLKVLIRSDPTDYAAWYAAAFLYKQLGNHEAARALYQRVAARVQGLAPP